MSHATDIITTLRVLKYGRKGTPHVTSLYINKDSHGILHSISYDSKSTILKKSRKEIVLENVLHIKAGITTTVLKSQVKDKTDESCYLSIISRTKTFDIKASSEDARDWLITSFTHILTHASNQRTMASKHVELCMMKRIAKLQYVYKYGRRGCPHLTNLSILKTGELCWTKKGSKTRIGKIPLDDIKSITKGRQTRVFMRLNKNVGDSSKCVSFVTKDRTLDLQLSSNKERDWLVVAIEYLMAQCVSRRAHLKRQKELCK